MIETASIPNGMCIRHIKAWNSPGSVGAYLGTDRKGPIRILLSLAWVGGMVKSNLWEAIAWTELLHSAPADQTKPDQTIKSFMPGVTSSNWTLKQACFTQNSRFTVTDQKGLVFLSWHDTEVPLLYLCKECHLETTNPLRLPLSAFFSTLQLTEPVPFAQLIRVPVNPQLECCSIHELWIKDRF